MRKRRGASGGTRGQDERFGCPAARGLGRRAWACLVGFAASLFASWGAAPEIRVHAPRALRPGVAAVLQLKGTSLAGTRALWTSWGGVIERRDGEGWECDADRVRVPVFVPGQVPAGIEAVRLLGTNGVSNLAWVWVDGLREESVSEDPTDKGASAPLLRPPCAIQGTFAEGGVRRYALLLNRGQRIGIEVVAQRMGSPSDPVLRVLNERGEECAYLNDTPGLGSDGALEFEAPATGEYRIEVRESEYAGGENLPFRLRVGAGPVGAVAFPAAVGAASGGGFGGLQVDWASVSASTGKGVGEVVALGASGEATPLARWVPVDRPGEFACTPRLKVLERWVGLEVEPNDSEETATPMGVSGQFRAGRFDRAADVDYFRITVSTSGWWRVSVQSRTLGLAADPRIRLIGAGNKVLARAAGGNPDPMLFHRFETGGDYWVAVDEMGGRDGFARGYVLEATPDVVPSWVSTDVDRVSVPAGGKQTILLKIEPRGYDGPLRIEAEGLPEGVEMENPDIEGRKKEWALSLRSLTGSAVGASAPVRFRVKAKADGFRAATEVDLGPARRKAFPRMVAFPPGFLETLWVAVVPEESPAISK